MTMSPWLTTPLFFFLFISIALSSSFSNAAELKTLAARVSRDSATGFYAVQMHQKTPLQAERLVLDIAGDSVWLHCEGGAYTSSTYRRVPCGTAICSASSEGRCGNVCYGPGICHNNTCNVNVYNAYLDVNTMGDLSQDVVALSTVHGVQLTIPRFAFSCAPSILINEMGKGIAGLAGLNKATLALPTQLSTKLGFSNKFAICLPGSRDINGKGVVFFGDGPYVFSPGIDVSKHLTYTPLVQYGQHKNQHYISVNTIQIDNKKITVPTGTVARLDSIYGPYSFLATPIYNAFLAAFLKAAEARNITRVSAVNPSQACFDARTISWTRVGPRVPTIKLILHNSQTVWKIFGHNSMMPDKRPGVVCLAIFDAGPNGGTEGGYDVGPIVISTHQMRDNLLQFDITNNRFGFSSTLLGFNTTCSNFNFNSNSSSP